MVDTDLDAALREVIFNTATAARAEGFQVQAVLGERFVSAGLCAIAPSIHIIEISCSIVKIPSDHHCRLSPGRLPGEPS